MLGRFFQLFMLAAVVLLLPSLFYLSRQHESYSITKDYSLMQTQSYTEGGSGWHEVLKQKQQGSQGQGAPPAVDVDVAQAWMWTDPWHNWKGDKGVAPSTTSSLLPAVAVQTDGVIMSKMANATAKAELGRATWRFLHTMTLRFPDKPTQSDRDTLLRFMHDFSRLYPCGECAAHFQQLLKELPPQTSSRMASALWLCTAHNRVNQRLGKPEFPCDKLDETYDCGCGDDKKSGTGSSPTSSSSLLPSPPA